MIEDSDTRVEFSWKGEIAERVADEVKSNFSGERMYVQKIEKSVTESLKAKISFGQSQRINLILEEALADLHDEVPDDIDDFLLLEYKLEVDGDCYATISEVVDD